MMPAMKRLLPIALAAALAAPDGFAAQWSAVRDNNSVKLSVDPASVKRKGDQVSLKYLVDYAKPQGDVYTQVKYLSVVTSATLRCKPRTVSLGMSELYSGHGGTGVVVATAQPNARERAFAAIEKGTSDEDLWRHACEKKAPAGKP
jgi:Surface-adhesin protein E